MIEVALQSRLGRDGVLDHVRGCSLARLAFSVVVLGPAEGPDRPRWIQCTAWGEQAEQLAPPGQGRQGLRRGEAGGLAARPSIQPP